jgi:hypothetical protein
VGTLVSNNITNNGHSQLSYPGSGILLVKPPGATMIPVLTANLNRIYGNIEPVIDLFRKL